MANLFILNNCQAITAQPVQIDNGNIDQFYWYSIRICLGHNIEPRSQGAVIRFTMPNRCIEDICQLLDKKEGHYGSHCRPNS